ncbi:MAG: hypothetical protein RMY30_016280 [Nostoc sp. CmiSLP01]|nr:hypothetical protein [Nostoc sp. CmiSLP01]MDZ8282259.1 hypothetical protein [Nostoc sp. ChiSLP01]
MATIALLAMLGFIALREKFFGTSNTPDTTAQSISPKPEKMTEKVRLLIRSEEDNELNEPIENVSVEFAVSNGSSSIKKTGNDGYADIEIPQGVDVVIYLKHKDYVQRKYTINSGVEPGKTKEYFLKRKLKANLSSISIPSKPEPTISGVWEGRYTCSLGITGVTVAIAQTGNKVIADFSPYPVPENPNIPRGVAKYEGDFNSTSRSIYFPRGTWIHQPAPFWTAFGFQGQFDENLEKFSGNMDHHSCKTINLSRKHS